VEKNQVAILPDSVLELGVGETSTGPISPNCGLKTTQGNYMVLRTFSAVTTILDAALQ
jgi:hypothetical protein